MKKDITVGFDLDGVLCDIDVTTLNLLHTVKKLDEKAAFRAEEWYYSERHPLLDPFAFLGQHDDYFIITSRKKALTRLTEAWVKKWGLDTERLFIVDAPVGDWKKTADMKAEVIKELDCDLYIDDNYDVVRQLRSRDILGIHYGGRVNWALSPELGAELFRTADKNTLKGIDPSAQVVTNARGGKQSHLPYRFDLIDGRAQFKLAEVLAYGASRYAANNWRLIPHHDHINHVLMHLFAYLDGDTQDDHLGHALCRLVFAVATQPEQRVDFKAPGFDKEGEQKQ